MHDPEGPANNQTIVATIPTRADHSNSEDGVLGMSLEPGLRPVRPDEARHLHLLLAAQPGLAHLRQRLHGRLQPDQPLHDDRRRHRVRGRLRAADPRGPEGEAGRRPDLVHRLPRRQRSRPRRRRRPGLRLERRPLPRASATTSRRTRAGTAPIRRSTTARRSTATRARRPRTPTTCAARSSGSTRSTTSRRGPRRASGRPTPSPRATCSRRGRPTRGPRSTRWASGSRSPSTPTRRTRARSPSASTATTRARTPRCGRRPAAASGTCCHSPASTAGRSASPTTPRRTPRIAGTTPTGATTGNQYDCSLANIPSDLDYAPAGQSNPGPTFDG